MADGKSQMRADRQLDEAGNGPSPLAVLSRTLEQLEARLSGLTPEMPKAAESKPAGSENGPATTGRPSLSDAVSQIVMRRQMLDHDAAPAEPGRAGKAGTAKRDAGLDRRFRALASEVGELQADGTNYALMAEVSKELQRLRQEMKGSPRFDGMREAFDGLRGMISRRENPEAIDAEIQRIDEGLARMAEEGAENAAVEGLRGELSQMREIVAAMSPGAGPAASPTEKAGGKTAPRQELKAELERLRGSLTSLVGEDRLKAIERHWNAQDVPGGAALPNPEAISNLLMQEMQGLREKLEQLAGQRAGQAVEERWEALEERFASREIEAKIERMADRMEHLEASLERLPETLQIATLEERIQSLALNIDALSQQQQEPDLDCFLLLEERLDEISRAIIANSRLPQMDMAPIERLDARLDALASKVDEIADDGEMDALSGRIAELAARIDGLTQESAAAELAERIEGFSQKLEALMAEHQQARTGAADMEARLTGLAMRLEEAGPSGIDDELVRSLEAQIARLSEHLGKASFAAGAVADPEFDRRLAAVEARLDDDRDAIIAAAREAADEAVRTMFESGDYRESAHVARLSEDLRSLEALSKHTDDRTNGFFDAVHTTLTKIVDRLNRIEADIARLDGPHAAGSGGNIKPDERGKAQERQAEAALAGLAVADAASVPPAEATGLRAAISRRFQRGRGQDASALAAYARASDPELLDRDPAPDRGAGPAVVEAPSLDAADYLDSGEMNRPLEIGSGAPDIAALLDRVRAQQSGGADVDSAGKADFIAAARRAAMAAAAEAEILRSPASRDDGEGRVGLADMIARRRKPILMAVGAVLLALMAMPLGRAFLATAPVDVDDTTAVADAANPPPADPAALPAAGEAMKKTAAGGETSSGTGVAAPAAPREQAVLAPKRAEPSAAAFESRPAATEPTPAAPARTASTMTGLLAPAASGQPLLASPVQAKPAAPATATADDPDLAEAGSALPVAATGPIPAMPDGIGTEALASAAKNGNPKALFEIGLRLMEGRSGEPRPSEALNWFGQAATRGFAPAQYSLGTLYEKGNGIERDTGAARDWYTLAAEQGNIRAMHNLAVLYATGIEGKSDPETAAEWFERAASYGMRDSQYNLGILYARGAGVEQDLAESYKWFSIVAAAGDKDAEEKKLEIAKSLSPESLKAAEAKVAAFAPRERIETANTVEIPKEWSDRSDHTASIDMSRAIRNIQAILVKLGYEPGALDGVAGKQTAEAIQAFQKDAGLQPTGEIDETLIRALLERKDG